LPLSEKARVEVYIPDLPVPAYQNLMETLEEEFTYGFGGCTIQRGLSGSYLSDQGMPIQDRINLIYTDIPYSLTGHLPLLSLYADELREAAFHALNEEAVLVTVTQVYHPT
jgi:hypothetical protein